MSIIKENTVVVSETSTCGDVHENEEQVGAVTQQLEQSSFVVQRVEFVSEAVMNTFPVGQVTVAALHVVVTAGVSQQSAARHGDWAHVLL